MQTVIKLFPLPLLAALVIACSGSAEPEVAPSVEDELALALDKDAPAAFDKARSRERSAEARRRSGRRGHRGGGRPAPGKPSACTDVLELSDGVCSRPAGAPCRSQDPDCVEPRQSCEEGGQTFPDGSEVPSGDSCNSCGCNDGSVICTLALCEPVFCALFVEEPDGVCSRFPLDPCISQDPDCTVAP